ncbi:unnamed protein product [Linum trigynum]|uniref:Angiotensin-converting enzyme 2 n=1 Tax=Linum trigynum TaxID=586398 RepID=A0AAV2FLH0_9ROSI
MDESPASYIHLVHRLIEECLVLKMSKEECMEALSKHANIKPVVTSTVWMELEKENPGFFQVYYHNHRTSSSSAPAPSTPPAGRERRIKALISNYSDPASSSSD